MTDLARNNPAISHLSWPARTADTLFVEFAQKLPPEYFYLGAARPYWDAISSHPSQHTVFDATPFASIADDVLRFSGGGPLTTVWLGAGNSLKERELQRCFADRQSVDRTVIHEIDQVSADSLAAAFQQNFSQTRIQAVGGTFSGISLANLRSSQNCVVVGMLGATISNSSALPSMLKRFGQELLSGDIFIADFTVVTEVDRRRPKSERTEGDAREVCNDLEFDWWQVALQQFAIARGLSLDFPPAINYRTHLFDGGYGIEIFARFVKSTEPLNLLSFVRCDSSLIDGMFQEAGLKVQQSYQVSPLLSLKIAQKVT